MNATYPHGMSIAQIRRNYREAYLAYQKAIGPNGVYTAKLKPMLESVKYWKAAHEVAMENVKYFGHI